MPARVAFHEEDFSKVVPTAPRAPFLSFVQCLDRSAASSQAEKQCVADSTNTTLGVGCPAFTQEWRRGLTGQNKNCSSCRVCMSASVLSGLRTHLMEPELFKEFCEEFTREVNRLRIERNSDIINQRKELERVHRELERAIQAILWCARGSAQGQD